MPARCESAGEAGEAGEACDAGAAARGMYSARPRTTLTNRRVPHHATTKGLREIPPSGYDL